MLYQETVDANTLALIREFMKRPELESFRLVGGTALSLQIGARNKPGRKRYFFDLFELLNMFSLTEMLQFYHQKFPGSDESIPIRSLIYFEDAEEDNLLKNVKNFNWQQIKTRITDEVKKL